MSNKGSEWRKWDLQIQPIKDEWFCDLDNKDIEIKNATRDYLLKAIEKKISVVAITDHNCGKAIDCAIQLITDENLDITVLPGVEIDVNTGYQILVILNPAYKEKVGKQSWKETVNHFLNHTCTLSSPVISTSGQAESINGDVHDMLDKICKEDIGIPIFAHSQSVKGLFKKTTAKNRKKFFEQCEIGRYFFAIDHKTDADVKATKLVLKGWKINSDEIALIKTSDAHKASIAGSAFTWIKSERTYEGLKQIMYDPKSRISTDEKEPIPPNNVIGNITFKIPQDAKITIKQKSGLEKEEKFCFAGLNNTFHLSPYFNCFVGGRGSGKSTILNCLGQYAKDPISSQSFWEKLKPSFTLVDKTIFSFEGVEIFEFIGQSEVENFATNQEAFTDAIYQRANLQSQGKLGICEAKLSKLLNELRAYESVISTLEDLSLQRSNKRIEKKTMENGIEITKSDQYSKIIEQITQKTNTKQELLKWRTAVEELRSSINNLQDEHFSEIDDQSDELAVETKELSKPYREAVEKAKTSVQTALDLLAETNFSELITKENTLKGEIDEHEKELSELLTKAGITEENVIQIKSAPQKIVTLSDEVKRLDKNIDDKEKELKKYGDTLSSLDKAKAEYEKIINDSIKPLIAILEAQATENKKQDIKNIGLSYFFDENQAWRDITDEFYNYFVKEHRDRERSDSLKNYIIINKETFSDTAEKINELLKKEEIQAGYIKFLRDVFSKEANYNQFKIIRDSHLNDVISHKRIQVLYDNKDIESASFGQKCTAVMVVLLLFGNYPLIVDEPEAHLDSSLIANYLVPLIKRKKSNRQLIFATHNANFVVNGDAEKIFVLKNNTGITDIVETTIEDLDNRTELLKLEGGKEAFEKRGEKLNIHKRYVPVL
jgi:energy-coupling factor transporter ATP-binding protein EcfA2